MLFTTYFHDSYMIVKLLCVNVIFLGIVKYENCQFEGVLRISNIIYQLNTYYNIKYNLNVCSCLNCEFNK